ncbi:MAG: dihydroorotase [Crocinitomicaceae bacterium]|nr:dihydroorotase [Crocinitomicaceae bacterium]
MNSIFLLKNATIVNEGQKFTSDLLIKSGRIEKIASSINVDEKSITIDLKGKLLLPGCIDDQVHFREPGLTHKATIKSESYAAVAGGITSFMEMPNTIPNATSQRLLEDKYLIAKNASSANYSFYMGASNDNIEEVLKTDAKNVCGVKVFMGSSTGNMLVDNQKTLESLFSNVDMLIATHCEDENTIRKNIKAFENKYGSNIPFHFHPVIRSEDACYISSSFAIDIAKKYGTRLHILHISTEKELSLFSKGEVTSKKITAEACVHHLWFSEMDYNEKGAFIKWNPAVKKESDRIAIMNAVNENLIDVIATDHAPHTLEEKTNPYTNAPSGGPLVQHALLAMLEKVKSNEISIETLVKKMAHAPADLFAVQNRGYIREGYFADLVVVSPNENQIVSKENCLYQCAWSPFEGQVFSNVIEKTFVNGEIAYDKNKNTITDFGSRLTFDRK